MKAVKVFLQHLLNLTTLQIRGALECNLEILEMEPLPFPEKKTKKKVREKYPWDG